MAAEGVYFRVMGRLAIDLDGGTVAPPGSRVLQGLLGALLLARGEPLSTDRLAQVVWTDLAESRSRASVHVGVSRLRKWLARLGSPGADALEIGYENGYLLRGVEGRVDVWRVADATEQARCLTDPVAQGRVLASVLEGRRGPILAELPYLDRRDVLVTRAERVVGEAVRELADTALRASDPNVALAAVSGMVADHPLDEPLHAALIDLLSASGRPAEALQSYHLLSRRIAEELGVDPSEEVQAAHLRVLSADRARTPPDDGGDPRTPGIPVPAQLPPDISDFTGREEEVALLTRMLAGGPEGARPGAMAIATVAGMGGLGKTTLAVHVAHRLAGAFPGGQLYIDMRGDSTTPADPGEVLGGFLSAFGLGGDGIPASVEERTALFRSRLAGRKALVVLDNAADEEQVRPLLPGTPDASVLVTSRNRLMGLQGATVLNPDVLSTAQAVNLITEIVGERRVQAEPDGAVEIARLCGHIPLAVRIAAARLRSRPLWTMTHLTEILQEERRRLDELAVGDLEVRAGFEMSYRRLPAVARRAFRMIGLLHAPDFASWAVAALLDVSPAEAQGPLETLIDAHLVNVVGVDQTGHLRYRMHDLVRLYARECAEAEETVPQTTAALRRALGAWLALAETAADRVPGPCYAAMHGTAPRWRLSADTTGRLLAAPMSWFAAERAALVAEVRQACALRLDEHAWDLAASTEKYCDVASLHDDVRETHERALRLCRETGNTRGEAVLVRGLLEVTTWSSPVRSGPAMATMKDLAERLLGLFAELDEPTGTADAMVAMVWGLVAEGAQDEALALAERALHLSVEAGYLGGQARAHHVIAVAHGERDADRARARLEQALVVAKKLGNRRFLATIVQFLGAARALCGDIEGGRKLLDDSLVMARELDDRYLETFSLLYLAKLFTTTGDERARPTIELALDHSRARNYRHHLADALAVLGELDLAESDLPAAIARLEQSVRIWRTRGWLPFQARTLRTLGDAHAEAGNPAAAHQAWEEARDLFERTADEAGRDSIHQRIVSTHPPPEPA